MAGLGYEFDPKLSKIKFVISKRLCNVLLILSTLMKCLHFVNEISKETAARGKRKTLL